MYALFVTQYMLLLFNDENFQSEAQNHQHTPHKSLQFLSWVCLILHVVENRGEREDIGPGAFPDKPISGKRSQSYGWMDWAWLLLLAIAIHSDGR